ncbi:hypothetical protein SERLADRAFT_469993 [Serpula lacrymans var. lacrymans S7.9]|uniref:Uncharacterized protein n=1 Tax=Serpula lacrymans var. lacrymans (strain S7.9) TaxID=578457 RepID=F8NYR0_SERL9|nr:uncharacterized protein SERLADRAFT_469993 [Serpula lacrymans var. lacrymans S7.9]EGO23731.1 hypothetical protein SERLADRAFT_469993 [Serpula lacrymans var. lacrymans S7.9]
MLFDPNMLSHIASSSAWFPLIFDTVVFIATMYRTVPSIRQKEAGYILRIMLEDGLLYYSIICGVNLVLTIMIVQAPSGLQNITAQLELLLTVTMMSRITLHLKKQAARGYSNSAGSIVHPISFARPRTSSHHSVRPPSITTFRPRAGSSSSAKSLGSAIRFPEAYDGRQDQGFRLSTILSESNTPNVRTPEDCLTPADEVGPSWEAPGFYEMRQARVERDMDVEA